MKWYGLADVIVKCVTKSGKATYLDVYLHLLAVNSYLSILASNAH